MALYLKLAIRNVFRNRRRTVITVAAEGSQGTVWVVTGNTATRRAVVLGADRIDLMEVKSGLVPGEAVILNPPGGLMDRARVRVKGKP